MYASDTGLTTKKKEVVQNVSMQYNNEEESNMTSYSTPHTIQTDVGQKW